MPICLIRSDQISKRQSQIDRLYVSLKDLVEERKCRLEQQYWLFQLHREVEELEQWIAEREISASSTELGQDYEHVTVRQQQQNEHTFSERFYCCSLIQKNGHFFYLDIS